MPTLPPGIITIGLLVMSNIFMTFAWYGHLKGDPKPLWIAVLGLLSLTGSLVVWGLKPWS